MFCSKVIVDDYRLNKMANELFKVEICAIKTDQNETM